MPIAGSGVSDPNLKFRFLLTVFIGIVLLSVIEFWKESLFTNSEYQAMPVTHEQILIQKENHQKQLTENQMIKEQLSQ